MKAASRCSRVWKGAAAAVCAAMLLCCTGTAWADAVQGVCISVDREAGQGSSGAMSVVHEMAGEGIGDSARLLATEAMPAGTADTSRASGTFDAVLGGTVHQGQAFEMLAMVNGERTRLGRKPLQWDAALEEAAMQRAAETYILFSHTRPDGRDCFTAFPQDRYAMGENIAYASRGTPSVIFNMWYNSPGHYANMVSADCTKVGMACFQGQGDITYWVQCFGAGGASDTAASYYDGPASFAISLPDRLISASYTSAAALTPGVDSMRALPTVQVAFNGKVGDSTVSGTVTYAHDVFSWSSLDSSIASISDRMGTLCCIGVKPGTTSIRAEHPTSSRLNQSVSVRVTQDGAFVDVDASTPHRAAVLYLSSTGVTAGYPDGSFKPYANVARADMAAFLRRYAVALGVSDAGTWQPGDGDRARFSDVDEGTAHAEDILWLAHAGISTGFEDGGFHPYASIARCDMAAFLRRFCALAGVEGSSGGLPGQGGIASFPDVVPGTPHRDDVLWLARAGITTGFPDGTFKPYGIVARCDMAAFLERIAVIVN